MKKLIISLISVPILTSTAVYAEDDTPWQFACEQPDLQKFGANRYFAVGDTSSFPLILADSQTIQINRKQKVIKVWTIWLTSEQGRQERIESLGKYDNYDNFGYIKYLDTINYGNMKYKGDASVAYNCPGSLIDSSNSKGEWEAIVPDSVMESIMKNIMKKYNVN